MALGNVLAVDHLPFTERQEYGSPYPEGIAVAASDASDDASGGAHSWSMLADGGFVYRLELVNLTRGEATARSAHTITSHRWAADRIPDVATSFDLNWPLIPTLLTGFSIYAMAFGSAGGAGAQDAVAMSRRFPMGRLEKVTFQQLMLVTVDVNIDGITNELAVVWSYWRKEALYRPGFLASFYEAPEIPTPIVATR